MIRRTGCTVIRWQVVAGVNNQVVKLAEIIGRLRTKKRNAPGIRPFECVVDALPTAPLPQEFVRVIYAGHAPATLLRPRVKWPLPAPWAADR
jgi:hypothetical protein